MIDILIALFWTFVFIRSCGYASTLKARTIAVYLLAGGLTAVVAIPFFQRVVVPYSNFSDYGVYVQEFSALFRQAVLFLPVLTVLLMRKTFRIISLADAFLIAYFFGFGFDLLLYLLAAASSSGQLTLSLLPPGQIVTAEATFPGYGYWNAIVVLVMASSMRFLRSRLLAAVLTIAAFVAVATEQASLMWFYAYSAKPESLIFSFVSTISLHGKLTAWVVVIAVVGLSLLESVWAKKSRIAAEEVAPGRLGLIFRGQFGEFSRAGDASRVRRRLELARAEAERLPGDGELRQMIELLEIELGRVTETVEVNNAAESRGWRIIRIVPWLGLAMVVFIFAWLPAAGQVFWAVPLVNTPIGSLPTLLNMFLMVVLLRRFILSPNEPTSIADTDETMQFHGEKLILQTCLGSVLIVFLYADLPNLYESLTRFQWLRLAALDDSQVLSTALLLLGVGCSGLALRRIAMWRLRPRNERRKAMIHNSLVVLNVFVGVWLLITLYTPVLTFLHNYFAAAYFPVAELLGWNGNNLVAVTVAIMAVMMTIGTTVLLNEITKRLEAFLIGNGGEKAAGDDEMPVGTTA